MVSPQKERKLSDFLCPSGAKTNTKNRLPRVYASLHPWLQPTAPPGLKLFSWRHCFSPAWQADFHRGFHEKSLSARNCIFVAGCPKEISIVGAIEIDSLLIQW
jgi:hypothetical protein